ncbi:MULTISPECIES: hypothetical protein [Paraburkholderia]|uniref:Uncharacterized protein n=1 Tax=Paraburkholderia podalyriae TaxID=1938811 RepID=A0ABR7Q1I2_9BURK|nr:hypothetical protein [Paraburkholderia podalyriae]MBC8752269.1 hypothetical protein [Paraburkholderia podalyriae]
MTLLNIITTWQPGCWCVAQLQLCAHHFEEAPTEVFRYPAQWAWFAWRPASTALPFRAPDGWGLTLEPPGPELAGEIGAAPVYLLDEAEADWPALLDILLVCDDLDPWLRSIVVQRHESERQARETRYAERYGVGESAAFERFLLRTVAGATDALSGEHTPADGESQRATDRTITLKSYPHCTATVQLRDDGALVFDLYDRDYLGSGRADTYCVEGAGVALLHDVMAHTTGERPATPEALLIAIGQHYPVWADAYRWLSESGVPFTHETDPWA